MQVNVAALLQVAGALEAVVCRSLGPHGGSVLFTRDTGEVLITRDGRRILASLRLDHPIARVLFGCVEAHCRLTGDGAKSFILLLVALLRGVPSSGAVSGPCGRRLADRLKAFQVRVLGGLVNRHVASHATALIPRDANAQDAGRRMQVLMGAYFRGQVSAGHSAFLAKLACDFYFSWSCQRAGGVDTLRLISDSFPELHTAVNGFPLSHSQVLEGLVLHRDFAVHCNTDGPLKALVACVPLLPPVADAGSTLALTSSSQVRSCFSWAASRAEQTVGRLRELGVGLLVSGVKQSELVLSYARQRGVSVVECLQEGELLLLCRLAQVTPFLDQGDPATAMGSEHTATVTFCRPVVLGSHRYVHLGLPKTQGFLPHCLVLCGPALGLTDQCVSAFGGAIRMVQWASQGCGDTETPVHRHCHSTDVSRGVTESGPAPSDAFIEPGSVLPVGGAFELLLHHSLLKHAVHSPCPDTQATCRLVAEALLSVPRKIHSLRGASRPFLEVHSRFSTLIQTGGLESFWDPAGLESLACKYQLLLSVLQCVRTLLSVDAIVYTSTLKVTDRDTDEGETD